MNLTKKMIILVGNPERLMEALKIICGFKACTLVKNVDDEIVKNVYKHNKNVVHATRIYDDLSELEKYDPVTVKVTKKPTSFERMELCINTIMEDFPALMDKLGIDVGDHIIHDSSGVKSNKCDCMICRIVEGNPIRKERVLYESENFFVVPGLGAFYDGYVMVCPKRHIMSFAECSEEEFEEFLQVMDDVKYILKHVYKKDIFVFECGSGRNGGGKHATSIVHAHIHFAPTDMPVLKCVQASGIYPALICPNDLTVRYGEYPYMLYIDQRDNWYISSNPNSYYPRQHPRQVLADYMGLEKGKYNWRVYAHEEKMEIIANEIQEFLKNNFDKLPWWIRANTEKFL